MTETIYDVAIIGGGPAGAWLAREMAKAGRKTILVERSSVLGEPNFSSGGAPLQVVEKFNLPKHAVAAYWDYTKLSAPNGSWVWGYDRSVGVVFDFRALKCSLLDEAVEAGARILIGTVVLGAREQKGLIELQTSRDSVSAKYVVDASGSAAVLAKQFGMITTRTDLFVGIEAIVETDEEHPGQSRTLELILGERFAPHGYAWVFPMGKQRFKIGLCCYGLSSYPTVDLGAQLDRMLREISWIRGARILEKHAGAERLRGGVRTHVHGRVLIIGDAADQANAFGAEGIRHALESASLALGVLNAAIRSEDPSALLQYELEWKAYTGVRWRSSAKIAWAMYRYFGDRQWAWLATMLSRLTPSEAFGLVFDYRYSTFLRTFFRRRRSGG